MLPNFLHIGTPKAASSWLWRVCQEHPDIYVPQAPDNVNFFTVHYHRGLDWYQQMYFAAAGQEKAVGEFSNSYMMFEPALERIARHLPKVRLTMTLRNPIVRAYLQWGHMHLKSKYKLNPAEGVGIPLERVTHHHGHQWFRLWIEPGLYTLHLQRIHRYFPKEQVKVMLYDDLCSDPHQFLRDFFDFLGVDGAFKSSLIGVDVNADRRKADDANGLAPALREELRKVFREDIDKLQDMLGRDLSHWR